MKTIETRYIPPSNTKGSRIMATDCGDHRIYVHTDHALQNDENHVAAARKLCEKLAWHGEFVRGATKTGYVFVFAHDDRFTLGDPADA
jgi:hypothetical protein